ncbi:MAG: hypothetical protein ABSF95_23345 [Verrucomicrobiota bacterium]|jgi:hypothetical protein
MSLPLYYPGPAATQTNARPLAALLLGLSLAASAAATQTNLITNPPRLGSPGSNALPAEVVMPKSVFLVPASPEEGRDPFFPASPRLSGSVAEKPAQASPAPRALPEVRLRGISGTVERPLAIIGNHTFAAGEEGEVITSGGRVRVRCLEIKDQSALVQVGGERRELRLRPGL